MFHLFRFSPPASPVPERMLRRASAGVSIPRGVQEAVLRRVRSRMRAPAMLSAAREALTPAPGLLERLLLSLRSSITTPHFSAWDDLRRTLTPGGDLPAILWQRILSRLEPVYVPVLSRPVKWVAAFALIAVVVRVSPLLFLAPPSIAESPVTLLPTRGTVEILTGSLWQPIDRELTLHGPTKLQTQAGEATIILHDDAVIRLAPFTRISLFDLSDRPERTTQDSTLALHSGRLWILGLIPAHVRGLTVVTSQGRVIVHEGSVSVEEQENVTVAVWDRNAQVARRASLTSLLVGEQLILSKDGTPATTKKVGASAFTVPWAAGNLSRDAAHQREIAQLQQERRAAAAGILPGSALYPAKRFAEKVDVLLTLGEEERARKLITQANTRLNEAAALIGQGEQGGRQAAEPLQEYRDTVLQVATGSGSNPAVQLLLERAVVEEGSATVAAALPGDRAYPLKQAVDDAIAALPPTFLKPDLEGAALLDQLSAARRTMEQGDTAAAREQIAEIAQSLGALETTGVLSLVPSDVREEAWAGVERVVASVEGPAAGALTLGRPDRAFQEPEHPARNILARPLTPLQITAKAQEIRGRIFVFGTRKAQYDALVDQLSLIARLDDRGRVLRELVKILPRNGLAQRVLREMQTVNEEVKTQVTASGGTAGAN